MLGLFKVVGAVYIYHRHTKQFLGIDRRPGQFHDNPVPVADMTRAANFKIRQGGNITPDPAYDPKTLEEVTEIPLSQVIRIITPDGNRSFNISSGNYTDGNPVILYPNSIGAQNENFELQMLSDFSFALGWREKCLVYDEPAAMFFSGPCTNLQKSSFDFYWENQSEKKVLLEDIYNLDRDVDPEFFNGDKVMNYHDNSNAMFSSPGNIVRKIATKDLNLDKENKEKIKSEHDGDLHMKSRRLNEEEDKDDSTSLDSDKNISRSSEARGYI